MLYLKRLKLKPITMKKITYYFFGFMLTVLFITSCASKKGCGLTGDAQKINQNQIEKTVLVAENN